MRAKDRLPELTVQTVLQNIKKKESWWGLLEDGIKEGKPVVPFISGAIDMFNRFEAMSQDPFSRLPKSAQEAAAVKAVWVVSGPGTYFQGYKQDRYNGKPWARWMDRQRINYAFRIGRKIAGLKLGAPISDRWASADKQLTSAGPLVVYNGSPSENAALLEAKKTPWLRMPKDCIYPDNKIFVIDPLVSIDSTADQVNGFRLPPAFEIKPGEKIGIVMHAPQAARFLYMLENFKRVIPAGINVRLFTLPTPKGGYPEYPMQEIRGATYYRFIANPPLAADSPYPYVLS